MLTTALSSANSPLCPRRKILYSSLCASCLQQIFGSNNSCYDGDNPWQWGISCEGGIIKAKHSCITVQDVYFVEQLLILSRWRVLKPKRKRFAGSETGALIYPYLRQTNERRKRNRKRWSPGPPWRTAAMLSVAVMLPCWSRHCCFLYWPQL